MAELPPAIDVAPPLDLPRIRCAPFREALHVDPIGSAGAYDAFLLVDVALPWESEVTAQEPLRTIVAGPTGAHTAEDGTRWRPLAVVPRAADQQAGRIRVAAHVADRGAGPVEWRGPYRRRDVVVDLGGDAPDSDAGIAAVVAAARRLMDGPAADGTASVSSESSDTAAAPSVLVCTHGRRDQCCGSLGTHLFEDLTHAAIGDVVLQRISHTGGHRFAPTAITFPDGYAWAHLDAATVEQIVCRTVPPAELADRCRGSSLFEGGPAQAAERAGLVHFGWEWADGPRAVSVLGFDRASMATTVRAVARSGDGVEVVVVPDRQVPSPTCGVIDRPEYKTDTVWRVLDQLVI